jgi:hypothetical protein
VTSTAERSGIVMPCWPHSVTMRLVPSFSDPERGRRVWRGTRMPTARDAALNGRHDAESVNRLADGMLNGSSGELATECAICPAKRAMCPSW